MVAGLALLSTLLVAVLTTQARVTRQWSHAQRKLEAVDAADRLVTGWWTDVGQFPRRAAGRVPGGGGLAWRTTPVANPELNAMNVSVVRVQVFEDARGKHGASRSGGGAAVLASVDVVLGDTAQRPGVFARTGAP